jgi:hypothetical protein
MEQAWARLADPASPVVLGGMEQAWARLADPASPVVLGGMEGRETRQFSSTGIPACSGSSTGQLGGNPPKLQTVLRIRVILVSWIRNPHSKCGFQMRMPIQDKLHKN